MATRFYPIGTLVPPLSPAFAAWTRTADAARRWMLVIPDYAAAGSRPLWDGVVNPAASDSTLSLQFHSKMIAVGTVFSTSDTFKGQALASEAAAGNNINRTPISLRVFNGTTLQATLKALGHYGPSTNEFVVTTPTNRSFGNSTTLDANYTSVYEDYLVLEVGGQVDATGGTAAAGSFLFGGTSAVGDLPEDESTSAGARSWFELSTNIAMYESPRQQYRDLPRPSWY